MWNIVKPYLFDQLTSRLLSPERQAKKRDALVLRKAVQKAIFREAMQDQLYATTKPGGQKSLNENVTFGKLGLKGGCDAFTNFPSLSHQLDAQVQILSRL